MKNKEVLFESLMIALDSPGNFDWSSWKDETILVDIDDDLLASQGPLRKKYLENASREEQYDMCNTTLCIGGNYSLIMPERFSIDTGGKILDMTTKNTCLNALIPFHGTNKVGPIFFARWENVNEYAEVLEPLFSEYFHKRSLFFNAIDLPANLVVYWILLYGMDKELFSWEDLPSELQTFYIAIKTGR